MQRLASVTLIPTAITLVGPITLHRHFPNPFVFINASRPGAQSHEVLHEQLPKILIHEPELVAVIVGGNDLLRNGFSPRVFEENLNETLAHIERMGATSMLLELRSH